MKTKKDLNCDRRKHISYPCRILGINSKRICIDKSLDHFYTVKRKLEELFPDEYGMKAYDSNNLAINLVKEKTCAEHAERGIEGIEFLFNNPGKSGSYFVDWLIIYAAVDEFLKSADVTRFEEGGRDVLLRCQRHYDMSADVLYERLGVFDHDRDDDQTGP